jgi:hypothetical protein
MVSTTHTRRSIRNGAPSVWSFLTVLLLILLSCSPCQGRKLLGPQEQGKVMHFEGGLVLRVAPTQSPNGEAMAAAPRGFSRAARSMRSVPSPGVGH